VANSLAEHRGGSIQPRLWSFVVAAVLLGILAALAMWAEAASMEKSTDQLWTAFQTILGVIVGFLGGEAAGVATAPRKE
jgi:H+/Cl- antiporter ClcA